MPALSELPNYFDRNPQNVHNIYRGTVGPHGPAQRWSKSIPKDKILMIEYLQISLVRASAAGPASIAYAYSDLAGIAWILAEIHGNTVGDRDDKIARNVIILGDNTIKGLTTDGSTGGTITYTLYLKGIMFDALPFLTDIQLPIEQPKPDIQEAAALKDPPM